MSATSSPEFEMPAISGSSELGLAVSVIPEESPFGTVMEVSGCRSSRRNDDYQKTAARTLAATVNRLRDVRGGVEPGRGGG